MIKVIQLETGVRYRTNNTSAAIRVLLGLVTGLVYMVAGQSTTEAADRQYCVACKEPDQTYVCNVETSLENPNDQGMKLFCIIQISKDGGHKSCAIQSSSANNCAGPLKSYTLKAPALSPELKAAVDRLRKSRTKNAGEQSLPAQRGGEPKTLIDMTGRAVSASRKGLSNTGKAVSGVGKGVTKAAGKVGSATKKTGGAVSGAAKTAYDCLISLFRECGGSK